MAVALIVAAGRGERLGSGRPKALATLSGRPMLEWSVRALRAVPAVEAIVVALPAGTAFSPSPGAPSARERLVTVSGGRTRSESVRAALAAAPPGDPVIVHDAARPLATAELFERALTEMRLGDADAVIAAVPVSDTIKEVDEDGRRVARTLERKRLWAAQTPQVFAREALERVLADASPALLASATDDAWLIERAGGAVRIMDSDPANIKVTTPDDLRVAEMLLSERQR